MQKTSLLFLILSYLCLQADPIMLGRALVPQDILSRSMIYIETEANSTIEDVIEEPRHFRTSRQEKLDLGFSDAQVWIRFALKNETDSMIRPVLVLDNPMLDHIDLYRIDGSEVLWSRQNGLLTDYDFKGALDFSFELEIPPGATQEFMLRVQTAGCALYFKATVMSKEESVFKEFHHQLMLSLFLGLVIGLIIYNLFIFFFTRDIIYLYYIGYQVSVILNYLSYTTISKHLLEPGLIAIDAFWGIYYLMGIMTFMLLFTRSLLQLQDSRWIDIGIKTFLALIGLLLVFTASDCCYPIEMSVYLSLSSSLYLLAVSLYMWHLGRPNALYIILGWGVSLFGSISLLLYQLGLASYVESLPYLYESTVAFEAILFSIILARRLNHTRTVAKALDIQKLLTKEMHERVKDNMQLIIFLYRLKFSGIKDMALGNRLIENENNIIAMSTIHDALYVPEDLDHLDTQLYFQKLIEMYRQNMGDAEITIDYSCSVELPVQQAIHCGIILNELVTNAIKYAFEPGMKGTISIALYAQGPKTVFEIKDDGVGFDQAMKKDTFGLMLVKALAQGELHASVRLDSSAGSAYRFEWEL